MVRRMIPKRLRCLIGYHRWVYSGDEFWIASIFRCRDCGKRHSEFHEV